MTAHAVARLVYETGTFAKFPLHIWAVAMMYFHAFEECTAERENDEQSEKRGARPAVVQAAKLEQLMLGVTCLVLSVKANENYLNSTEPERTTTARLAAVLDATARVILSYTAGTVPTERIVQTKRRLKEFIPPTELSIMRVIGNALVPETAFSVSSVIMGAECTDLLVELYSSPVCLNFPASTLLHFASGDQRTNAALLESVRPYFTPSSEEPVEPISP
jgi:hypothetical protein